MVVDVPRARSQCQRHSGPTSSAHCHHAHPRGRRASRPVPHTDRGALRHPRQCSELGRSDPQESPIHNGSPGKVGAQFHLRISFRRIPSGDIGAFHLAKLNYFTWKVGRFHLEKSAYYTCRHRLIPSAEFGALRLEKSADSTWKSRRTRASSRWRSRTL